MDNKTTNKRHTTGVLATLNRLETSKPIASTLKKTANGGGIPFLKEIAICAMDMIWIIQEIDDGDIDDNFVALTLDAFGLVYIVIHQFQKEIPKDTDLLDRMKISLVELERNLQDIRLFVEKKARRNLAQRILKHNADEQRVEEYRTQVRNWLTSFGKSSQKTVHEVVEQILDRKLRKIERNNRKNKDLPEVPGSNEEPDTTEDNLLAPEKVLSSMSGPRSASPGFIAGRRPLHVPPNITISPRVSGEHLQRLPTPGLDAQRPQTADIVQRSREEKLAKERAILQAEDRKRRIFEQERARKIAERERWQRSQQQFTQLPEVNPDDLVSPVASTPLPVSIVPPTPAYDNDYSTRRSLEAKRPLPAPISEDEKLAAALHAATQRELELEDERKALKIAAKLQLEMEAEERKRKVAKSKLKTNKRGKSKTPSSDGDTYGGQIHNRPSRSPSPNVAPRLQPQPGQLNGPRPSPHSAMTSHPPVVHSYLNESSPEQHMLSISRNESSIENNNARPSMRSHRNERYDSLP